MRHQLIERRTLQLSVAKYPDDAVDYMEQIAVTDGWRVIGWRWLKAKTIREFTMERAHGTPIYKRFPRRWRQKK